MFSFGILSLSHVCLCMYIFLSLKRHQQITKINGSTYMHINMYINMLTLTCHPLEILQLS